ncbi:hypothetical protein HDE_01975 [Halotydeus destructor]|nr:hypothetical protein HDE_01975 [Halotydeus destructor]
MRKQSVVWSHWEEVLEEDGSVRWKCLYCPTKHQVKNATKCSEHTRKCKMRIENGVEFVPKISAYTKAGNSFKRKLDESHEFDQDNSASQFMVAELTELESNPSSFNSHNPSRTEPSSKRQQIVELLTDFLFKDETPVKKPEPRREDTKREEQELRLKELRLSVRQMQLKNQLLERLVPLSEKAALAIDHYLSVNGHQSGSKLATEEAHVSVQFANEANHSSTYQI